MSIYLSTYDDQSILLELQNGNDKAFDALYDKYWDFVYTSAYKRLQNTEQAKDITQDIFLKLWNARQNLQVANLPAYLQVATRNSVFKLLEKEQKYTPASEVMLECRTSAQQADTEILYRELFEAYQKMIGSLTTAQQTIFKMRYDQEQSTSEIAQALGISRKTVQNQLGKSINQLRESLLAILICMAWMYF
ncbi:sigma-70 family RNA polymerase sigma factor [Pedobacter sp. KR3-3]|uniref:Sigma-70 family RNA polymerase sigma factor n=1 Tax=Pedobacter albus TaxID=3113905 RepID=A0ABU7I8M8_9SPHI|nr:sigma-70 family RNA polymerase sigma factor [Pedobacter sp. KR3-3]MEE1945828.1 sigma-70 family RNA polymerase sigma factor [Pedobacter sp. KR3-3]